jgi:hypothetical protein
MTLGARALGAVIVASSLLAARGAAAADHRVTVVDADPTLVHALDVALSPWGVAVDARAVAGPGATMPMATDRARALAADARADVVVWLSRSDAGYAVWVYDAEADHASARGLPAGPPFDDTTAAGIALSVKTTLRATKIAPPRERFGAPPDAADDTTWRFDLSGGAAVRSGTPSAIEPRAGLGASFWPAAYGRHLGFACGAELGTGVRVQGASFTGTAVDASMRVAIVASWPLARGVAIEPSLGGAAHVVVVDGFVVTEATPVSVLRLDPAIEPRLALDFAAFSGRLRVAPWVGAAYMIRSQELLVHGATVLDLAPLVAQGGVRVSLGVE